MFLFLSHRNTGREMFRIYPDNIGMHSLKHNTLEEIILQIMLKTAIPQSTSVIDLKITK